jgi:hypothetical protein
MQRRDRHFACRHQPPICLPQAVLAQPGKLASEEVDRPLELRRLALSRNDGRREHADRRVEGDFQAAHSDLALQFRDGGFDLGAFFK